jgi:4a-hydroxytetrahydrobiopterin dehydratase
MTALADLEPQLSPPPVEPLNEGDIERFAEQLPAWTICMDESPRKLLRRFPFANFRDALDFTNRVGELAEAFNHHPALTTEWAQVTVTWWSHSARGIHQNDLIMAAKTDVLFTMN